MAFHERITAERGQAAQAAGGPEEGVQEGGEEKETSSVALLRDLLQPEFKDP
jgi:hypothetical protein